MNPSVKTAHQTLERFQAADVCEPEGWAQGLLPGALRLPLSRLKALVFHLERKQPVLPHGRSSDRSREARQILQKLGRPEVWQLTWRKAGIPHVSAA